MTFVVVLALSAALFFGVALVLTQAGLRYLEPLHGACISVPSACAVFVAASPFTVDWGHWNGQSAAIFAVVGFLFPATVTILTFYANRAIGPTVTGALGNLAPLFALLIAIVVLNETPGAPKVLAALIVIAGVVMLYRAPRIANVGWVFALPIAAAFIRGMVQPVIKIGLAGWPNPFAAVTIGYLVSTLVAFASAAIRARGWPLAYNGKGWLWFWAVGMCNGLAVLCMYQALSRGPVTLVAPLVACYPLATLAFGRMYAGHGGITRRTVSGVFLIVAGVGLLLTI